MKGFSLVLGPQLVSFFVVVVVVVHIDGLTVGNCAFLFLMMTTYSLLVISITNG